MRKRIRLKIRKIIKANFQFNLGFSNWKRGARQGSNDKVGKSNRNLNWIYPGETLSIPDQPLGKSKVRAGEKVIVTVKSKADGNFIKEEVPEKRVGQGYSSKKLLSKNIVAFYRRKSRDSTQEYAKEELPEQADTAL